MVDPQKERGTPVSEAADLLELQFVDVEILRATKRLDELPEKRAILEVRAKQREIHALAAKAGMLVRKLESEVKARQDEATMIKSRLGEEQTKVMAITDHRAVQSITREMDGLKRRCDKIEMEELQFMERVDKARGQTVSIMDHLAKLVEKEAELIEQFKKVGGGVQTEIAKLQTRRKKLLKALPSEIVSRYEMIRASKSGVGVGKLEDARCSACRMELPAERVQELLNGPDVSVCPQCRRLIVVRDGER